MAKHSEHDPRWQDPGKPLNEGDYGTWRDPAKPIPNHRSQAELTRVRQGWAMLLLQATTIAIVVMAQLGWI